MSIPRTLLNIPTLTLALLLATLCARQASAQVLPGSEDAEAPPQGSASISVSLVDPSGYLGTQSYQGIQLVAAYLPQDWVPFDEFTQGQWSSVFNKIAVGDVGFPQKTEVWLYEKLEQITGETIIVSSSNSTPTQVPVRYEPLIEKPGVRITMPNLRLGARIALAAYCEGVWWPASREFYFDEDGEQSETTLNLHAISFDDSQVEITSYDLESNSLANKEQRQDLRWHKISLREVIEIRNPSTTHAVIPKRTLSDYEPEEFLSLSLIPPPGVDPLQLSMEGMLGEWTYFVGVRSDTPIEYQGYDPDLEPYTPWTHGQKWTQRRAGSGGSASPHGMTNTRGYKFKGAKNSGHASHPLNQSGMYDLWGAGDVFLRNHEGELRLVINKPIPPGGTLHIELEQHPGFSYENIFPVNVSRIGFPYPVQDVRLLNDPLLRIRAESGLIVTSAEPGIDGLVRPEVAKEAGKRWTMSGGQPFSLIIDPSEELRGVMAQVPTPPEASAGPGAERQVNLEALASKIAAERSGTGGLVWKRVYSALALLFGLGFIVALIVNLGSRREVQLERLRSLPVDRAELIAELKRLESDYDRQRIPPAAYLEERTRLMSRLVELEASKG